MRVPNSRADETMRQIVRLNSTTYTVQRPDYDSSSKERWGESVTETTSMSVDAYLYFPSEENTAVDFGERLEGDLQGLALPAADVQVNDQYEHGTETYQVEDVVDTQSDEQTVLQRFSLTKMTNN